MMMIRSPISTRCAAAPFTWIARPPRSPRKMYVVNRSPFRQLAMCTTSLTRIPVCSSRSASIVIDPMYAGDAAVTVAMWIFECSTSLSIDQS